MSLGLGNMTLDTVPGSTRALESTVKSLAQLEIISAALSSLNDMKVTGHIATQQYNDVMAVIVALTMV
jgi:hypothetical protein